jgi:hypothetical protein
MSMEQGARYAGMRPAAIAAGRRHRGGAIVAHAKDAAA